MPDRAALSTPLPTEVARARRPQWLILMLLSEVVFERPSVIATGSVIDVLGRLGVAESATRSTLNRMTGRGLLGRHPLGRQMYFGLTERATTVLREGEAAARRAPDRPWSGTWTVLGFSLPGARHELRHRLRSRLTWAGFGLLQSGLWIAPGEIDVGTLLSDLDVLPHIRVFTARPASPTEVAQLIHDAYDLEQLAGRYAAFIERWSDGRAGRFPDALCALIVLQGEWSQIARADPGLPLEHLPPGWPAMEAHRCFHRRYSELEPAARRVVDADVLIRPLTPGFDGEPAAR